ncbi:MAG: M23 family metallopeptidase [Firmicutes bacterium]|nr:M23 family metallopeptidase [Bacillota bacterium]
MKKNEIEQWIEPVNGIITSSCGERENPILQKMEYHNGLDIAVAENTQAVAVKSGIVTEVRNSETLGKVLKYETEDGYTVMYAHLNDVLVKKGENVKQGQIVAMTGNTGLSTGPHIHYSIWRGDMLINPMQFVDLNYTEEVKAEYLARGVKLP